MPTIKDIVQKGREEFEEKFTEPRGRLDLPVFTDTVQVNPWMVKSHIDSRIIDVLEYSHKEIENIDISIMTYGAFRRQVLSLITSFIDEIKK